MIMNVAADICRIERVNVSNRFMQDDTEELIALKRMSSKNSKLRDTLTINIAIVLWG